MRERESILHDGCALCSDFNCDDSCVISDEGKCKYNRRISLFCTACTGRFMDSDSDFGSEERDKKYITCKVGIGGKWIGSCRNCSNIYQGACVDDRDEDMN